MDDPKKMLWAALLSALSLLLAGNLYFISKLVDKLERTEQMVWELRQQVAVLNLTIDEIRHRHRGDVP